MHGSGKAAQAYEEIERLITFEELAPGSLVSESVLMEATGLGRTPVREALQRLARNRMVEIHPNKGVLVPPNTVEMQMRLLDLRRALEGLAVGLAAQRATAEERSRMAALAERVTAPNLSLIDYAVTVKETHVSVAGAAHNPYLADALAPAQGLSRRFWISHTVDEAREIRAGSALHEAILRAIVAGDVDAARAGSSALNDYLVAFTRDTVDRAVPMD